MIGVSAYSSDVITEDGLAVVMGQLQAVVDELQEAWRLERSGRVVFIQLANEDIDLLPDYVVDEVVQLLGAPIASQVSMFFEERTEDSTELRMAKAATRAMSELWTLVFDDHANGIELVGQIGQAKSDFTTKPEPK